MNEANMSRRYTLACYLAVTALLWTPGCGHGGVDEMQIEVKASNDPLTLPRSVLQQYANGQPMGSEVSNFPAMIETVRDTDPNRAEILEKGLAEIQASPASSRSAKAKALLEKIQPSMH